MEIFKDIKGYPDYQVSDQGRVWNAKTQRMLKPSIRPNGYFQVNMVAANGLRKKEYIHRLVALTFIENPDNKPQIDHIDRDRGNNTVNNLRWVSSSENQRNTTQNHPINQYDQDGILIAEYQSIAAAVEAVNGTTSGMYSHLQGKAKTYKGFVFKTI